MVWAIITPRVFGPMAAAIASSVGTYVPNSTSMKTGTAPICKIGLTVVGNAAAGVMISSPGRMRRSPNDGEVKALAATRFADEPELTSITELSGKNFARPDSSSAVNRPAVSQKSRTASTPAQSSSASKTRPP